jgi:GMP synthase PP-ATPase subunit
VVTEARLAIAMAQLLELFKDEVRRIGLGVRILGEVWHEYAELLRRQPEPTTTLLRPAALAAYMAWSARL